MSIATMIFFDIGKAFHHKDTKDTEASVLFVSLW